MDDLVFTDKLKPPKDAKLKSTLNTSFPYFKKLKDLTSRYIQEWKYYNTKSGWIFKVSDKKRSVFYITPLKDSFRIGMTVNESQKEVLLNSNISNERKEELSSVKKYQEGYPVRSHIKNEKNVDEIIQILSILNKI